VVVEDLKRWRAAAPASPPTFAAFLPLLERYFADFHRAGDHRLVGLRDEPARLLYAEQLKYIAGRLETDQPK
jgi:hypothetical protein